MTSAAYLHLPPGAPLPALAIPSPYKAVLVIEADVEAPWRDLVSSWLVETGCRYMMAWGQDCSAWDDSVDHANLERFDYADIPEHARVMTTWHADESLAETFSFAVSCASLPDAELQHTLIVHVSPESSEADLWASLEPAQHAAE